MGLEAPAGQGTFRSKYLAPTLVWNTGTTKSFVRTLTATDDDHQPDHEFITASVSDSFTSVNAQRTVFSGSPDTAYEDLCISDELLAELEAEIEQSVQQTPRMREASAASARQQPLPVTVPAARRSSYLTTAVLSDAQLVTAPLADIAKISEQSIDIAAHGNTDTDEAKAHDMLLEALSTSKAENAKLAAALTDAVQQLEQTR